MKDSQQQTSFTSVVNIIHRRKWTAITVFSAIFILVLIATFKAEYIYRSVAKIAVSQSHSNPTDVAEQRPVNIPLNILLNTETQLLTGTTFLESVIKKIDEKNSDLKIKELFHKEYKPDENILKRTNKLRRSTKIESSNKSNVITIYAESKYPEVAALIANTFVEAYEDYNRKRKEATINEHINMLKAVIDEAQKSVNEAGKALSKFRKEKGIYALSKEDEASLDKATLNLYLNDLPSIEKQLSDAEIPYNSHKTEYEKFLANSTDDDKFLEFLPAEILQSKAKTEYDQIRQNLESLKKTRGNRHPKIREATELLNLKRRAIAQEYSQFMARLEKDYKLARQKLDDYRSKIESFDQERTSDDETTAELNLLQARYDVTVQSYNALQQQVQEKYKELGALKGAEKGNFVSLIDKGHIPMEPSKPNRPLNLALGFIIAAIGGFGMAFLQEHLDVSIKSQEDIEEFLEIPLLGAIPLMKHTNNSGPNKEIVVVSDPKSLTAEAFKTVRTGLFFASRNNDLKTILITSGAPGEGKTLFAVNLALTIAQSGSKTLLIDADIRKPRVHKILQLDNSDGLTSYLSRAGATIKTQKASEDNNLYVVTSGPVKTNPTELLGSPKMKTLIDEARKRFDKIIIDTPPVMTVSDPLILTGISDGVVQVINFGKSNKRVQLRTKSKINSFGGRIVGAVLNRVELQKDSSSLYYQGYYYGHQS